MRIEHFSFGRHETFPLRFNWIPKAFLALQADPNVFKSESATVDLGVGKNMVSSIRYWLLATRLIDNQDVITPLGHYIFDPETGADPYMEDEGTIWLLHWLLSSNVERATTLFWFFNSFHKHVYSTEEISVSLRDFLVDSVSEKKQPSQGSQKSDVSILTRMYCHAKVDKKTAFEDILSSPFTGLGLILEAGAKGRFSSSRDDRNGLPAEILLFAVCQIADVEQTVFELDGLMHFRGSHAAPGAVFRLSEEGFVSKLEAACELVPDTFKLERSGVLVQLFKLKEIDEIRLLDKYYRTRKRKAA